MNDYDYVSDDLAGAQYEAGKAYPREHELLAEPRSCRGCTDRYCPFCEE